MPVMEVVLQQNYNLQEVVNRFNYLASGTPASVSFSFALTSALGAIEAAGVYPPAGLMKVLANMQENGVTFNQVAVKDVYSVTDFYQLPFVVPLVGGQSGVGLSPTSALGFYTNRTRLDVRRGQKRFVGVPAGQVGEGGALNSTYRTTVMQPVADVLGNVLTYDDEGNTLTFTPVVCGREKYVPDPLHPDRFAYRYYATEVLQLQHTMTSLIWSFYSYTRTQASRQYGRGR